jgi:hypothetical protein
MIDVTTNPTGREKGSQTTVQKIQLRQNAAMRACLGIRREDRVGTEQLLKKTGLAGIEELSTRASCMLSWRWFADKGDLQDIVAPRLQLQNHRLVPRSDTSGRIIQDTVFQSFAKKGATLFNAVGESIRDAGKSAAKLLIPSEYKHILKRVQDSVQWFTVAGCQLTPHIFTLLWYKGIFGKTRWTGAREKDIFP